ncbi:MULTISPECIES: NEL-type E3 ubiquitin ligase domain-containing protein [Pseudomonas]|uniref:NEL-type E3 ubiquitin ligase domain-containing protein n=1 Tax=Pseudomonas TaxID=286 RepID=UPI000A4C5173|nr:MULTISPECIES: NEL-type E3 ubiquitin ligase domain-containing protein [Pseudomonas]MEE1917622.1 NEL-type E3 ubiquitin ligase domain-containing protein [Pseudomonas asiatica]
MTSTPVPFHQAQIVRNLPTWCRTMHPDHTRRVVQSVRKDYLDENGSPYAWYAAASDEDQARLRQLISARNAGFKALQALLDDFRQISEFCKPLLEGRLGPDVEVDKAQYLHQPFKVYTTLENVPGLDFSLGGDDTYIKRPEGPPQKRSLLEAALHNFEGPDEVGPFDTLTLGTDNVASLPGLEPEAFVNLCRSLNLGQQYQDHLQGIYEGPRKAAIEQQWIDASQQALKTEAMIAYLKGLLTLKGHNALVQLCDNESTPRYGEHKLRCWRFSLFGIPLHGVLLIGPDEADQTNPCMLYIPHDSEHPVREFASLQKAGSLMRQRLVQTTFRQHLISFADQDNQVELSRKLENALFEHDASTRKPKNKPELHFKRTRLAFPIWQVLYRDHKRRVKATARAIAVPTADADAKARKERLQHWLDAGMNVLNVAAFFVPGLDAAMLGVFAYDLMDSVFTGFEAWEEGDTQEALQQLESLAINAAVIAGFAVGSKALKASGFVDALESVWKGGRERLWHPDMGPYSTSNSLPVGVQKNAQGLYIIDGKTHVWLQGKLYEVFETDGQWHVRHPDAPDAYTPALRNLGDQRWQLAHDNPLEWDDAQLLEGLGRFGQGLDASDQLAALRITEVDADTLRRSQVTGSQPPPLLADTLLRLRLADDVEGIITRVRHGQPLAAHMNFALPELVQLPGWPENYRLKVFTGAEKWGEADYFGAQPKADTVQIEIGREELDDGELSKIVLAGMDEDVIQQLLPDTPVEQRPGALNELLANHLTARRHEIFASMLESHRAPLGDEAQTLGRQFPGLPDNALEELVAHADSTERERLKNGRVPLRVAEEARYLQARARLDRALTGLYRADLANADSQLLRDALVAEQPQASEAELFASAVADRSGCAVLLGQQSIKPGFRSPMRLAHGRIGYPLSGRGAAISTSAATSRLNRLFPSLNSKQITALSDELSRTRDLGSAIRQLETEWQTLDSNLESWYKSAPDIFRRQDREKCAESLKEAWRREGSAKLGTLVLEKIQISELPAITASLPYIRELKLNDLQLQRLDRAFLSCFPNLQVLRVTNIATINPQALFEALEAVPKLQTLDLTNNTVVTLSPTAQRVLAAMPGLRELNLTGNNLTLDQATLAFLCDQPLNILKLSRNRITLDENLATRFQDMIHPQQLDLSFNSLQHAPDVRYMARLQHLDLDRTQLHAFPPGLSTLMNQRQYQLRYLNLSSNHIPNVPDLVNILRSPYVRDVAARVRDRRWLFNYNNLEAEPARQLRARGVNIFEHPPERQEWQRLWRDSATDHQVQVWSDLFDQNDNGDLQAVLERLTDSVEARRDLRSLRARVWELLEQAHGDAVLRERLNEVAKIFPPTCGDAGADAFSALEVELLIHQVSGEAQDTAKPILDLYRKLYRREKVNELADRISLQRGLRKRALQEHAGQLPDRDVLDVAAAFPDADLTTGLVDDIEVRLALRQSLSEDLDFPEPSSGMLYRDLAKINQQIIDNVRDAVVELDADTTARQLWISERPVWVDYLKRKYASQFEAITDFWRPGLDYLFYCLDESQEAITHLDKSIIRALAPEMPGLALDENGTLRRVPLSGKAYFKAMEALTKAQEEVEAGLLLSLTRQEDILDA